MGWQATLALAVSLMSSPLVLKDAVCLAFTHRLLINCDIYGNRNLHNMHLIFPLQYVDVAEEQSPVDE